MNLLSPSLRFCASAVAQSSSSIHSKNSLCPPVEERKSIDPKSLVEVPIFLKPSSNPRRKPTFYIPRMREERTPSHLIRADGLGTAQPLFTISSGCCEYYALRLPLLKAGFKRVVAPATTAACNLIWGRSLPLRKVFLDKTRDNNSDGHVLTLRTPQTEERAAQLKAVTMKFPTQFFNHFPLSHANIGCKKGLTTNISAMGSSSSTVLPSTISPSVRNQLESMYSFTPKTWCFPEEKEALFNMFRNAPSSSQFIWKPARGSCGRGIFFSEGGAANARSWERVEKEIQNRLETEQKSDGERVVSIYKQYVVQEYVDTPLLLDGRKMDLRLYVAVMSYDPLVIYLHEDGLCRLAAEQYDENQTSIHHFRSTDSAEPQWKEGASLSLSPTSIRFKRLTNFSVGRKYAKYAKEDHTAVTSLDPSSISRSTLATASSQSTATGEAKEEEELELKWSLPRLWNYIDEHYPAHQNSTGTILRSQKVREEISLIIVRTLMAVQGNMRSAVERLQMPGQFAEVYGVDVLLKEDLSPVLLEVNTLPSLESSSPFDYEAKSNMMADFLNLMMMEAFEREGEEMMSISTSKKLAQSPQKHLVPFIHTLDEQRKFNDSFEKCSSPFRFHHTNRREDREDLQFRLKDELIHARGFKRIFPPISHSAGVNATLGSNVPDKLHLQETSDSIHHDINFFDSLGFFSGRDKWALSC